MRINIIPVEYLSDVHLRAEYREILMSCHYYKRSAASKSGIIRSKIPKEYTLNSGHAMFFYNKMLFVKNRHDLLEKEMISRGFKIRETYDLSLEYILPHDMNDYIITQKDIGINLERILIRIHEMIYLKNKSNFYKIRGKVLSYSEWCKYYESL